eukprot:365227-Chlamydomonas_euryale.AAC.2
MGESCGSTAASSSRQMARRLHSQGKLPGCILQYCQGTGIYHNMWTAEYIMRMEQQAYLIVIA